MSKVKSRSERKHKSTSHKATPNPAAGTAPKKSHGTAEQEHLYVPEGAPEVVQRKREKRYGHN